MKKINKKRIRTLLVLHGIGINLIGSIAAYLYFRPTDKVFWLIIWLISFQINAYCIFKFKKNHPDMVDATKDRQKSPWLIDLLRQ